MGRTIDDTQVNELFVSLDIQLTNLAGKNRDLPGDCFIGHLVLSEAEFKLVVDSETGRFRVVLLRGDHTAAVCFDRQYQLIPELHLRFF